MRLLLITIAFLHCPSVFAQPVPCDAQANYKKRYPVTVEKIKDGKTVQETEYIEIDYGPNHSSNTQEPPIAPGPPPKVLCDKNGFFPFQEPVRFVRFPRADACIMRIRCIAHYRPRNGGR